MKKNILIFSLLLLITNIYSQFSKIHYVPPVYAVNASWPSPLSLDIGNHYVVLSTTIVDTFIVTMTDGGKNTLATFSLSLATPVKYLIGNGYTSKGLIDRDSLNIPLISEGLIFTGSYPFYVDIRHRTDNGQQGASLTSKGLSALGKEFRTGHLYSALATGAFASTNNTRGHFVSVMATEDNTNIVFDQFKPGVVFLGTSTSGTPATTDPINIILNEGESYVIGQTFTNTTIPNEFHGVRITASEKIVVNTGSWLASSDTLNKKDIGMDQIVPIEKVGKEYIIVKGEGTFLGEAVIAVATKNNTDIFVNANASPITTLVNAGDFYVIRDHFVKENYTNDTNMYVRSTEPIYIYQTTSGAFDNRTVGLNFIPPLNCASGKDVLIPYVDLLVSTSTVTVGGSKISVIARAGATVNINGAPITGKAYVPGKPGWVSYKTGVLTGHIEVTSDSSINVALLTEQSPMGAAGYYSGFDQVFTKDTLNDSTFSFVNATGSVSLPFPDPYHINITKNPVGGSVSTSTSNDNLLFNYLPAESFTGKDTAIIEVCGLDPCSGEYTSCSEILLVYDVKPIFFTTPNVFTPNGDGINEIFSYKQQGIESVNASIFNRWGIEVYQWNTVDGSWNGNTHSGNKCAEGTYFYIINYVTKAEKEGIEKGFITLIR